MTTLREAAHRLLPGSLRFRLRTLGHGLNLQLKAARLWQWELVSLDGPQRPYEVCYLGPKDSREHAAALVAVNDASPARPHQLFSKCAAWISQAHLPGALRVPQSLHALVPLRRSLEEITQDYSAEARRYVRLQRERYSMRQVTDEIEVDVINRTMLEPYAEARHGSTAVLVDAQAVLHLARRAGRLDLISFEGEPVACHLGYALNRGGKKYWVALRFGYPFNVFSDPKRLAEVNSMNVFMALERAFADNFDFYDMGSSRARPDDGLLQWKRRRGGEVDTLMTDIFFSIRLPTTARATFLWDCPLFAVEQGKLVLMLGLPTAHDEQQTMQRYRQMGFGGLSTVYLHCESVPSRSLLNRLRGLFRGQVPELVPVAA